MKMTGIDYETFTPITLTFEEFDAYLKRYITNEYSNSIHALHSFLDNNYKPCELFNLTKREKAEVLIAFSRWSVEKGKDDLYNLYEWHPVYHN